MGITQFDNGILHMGFYTGDNIWDNIWDGMLRTFLGWSLNSRGFLSTKLGGAATFGKMGGCQTRSCSGHTNLKLIRKRTSIWLIWIDMVTQHIRHITK